MPGLYHGDLPKQDPRWHGNLPSSLVCSSWLSAVTILCLANPPNRSNIGSIIVSVMMQQLNQRHPDNYLLAMRILWAPIGLMIICWVIVPESPWFHARRGNKDEAIKSMKQLYGGVQGYDFEEEYGIIARTIEHERELLQETPRYVHIFKGLNLVSAPVLFKQGGAWTKQALETYSYRDAPCRLPTARWPRYHQHLFNLCVTCSSPACVKSRSLMAQTSSLSLVWPTPSSALSSSRELHARR